jgi:hypothetical protein
MIGQGRTNIRNPTNGILFWTCTELLMSYRNSIKLALQTITANTGVIMKSEGTLSQQADISANWKWPLKKDKYNQGLFKLLAFVILSKVIRMKSFVCVATHP